MSLTIKPSPKIDISLGPDLYRTHSPAQYVAAISDPSATATYGSRYIFSNLEQTEASLTTRLNVIFQPTVSLQVYMQPLLSTGRYWDFKELAKPRTFTFRSRRKVT